MKNILSVMLLLIVQVNAKDYICYYPKSCDNFTFYSAGEVKNWEANYKITTVCSDISKVYRKKYNLIYKIKNSKDIVLKIIHVKD